MVKGGGLTLELEGPWFRSKLIVHGPLYPFGFVQKKRASPAMKTLLDTGIHTYIQINMNYPIKFHLQRSFAYSHNVGDDLIAG